MFIHSINKIFTVIALAGCVTTNTFAQAVIFFNNGAQIYTAPSAIVKVNGGFQNDGAAGVTSVFDHNGTMTIANSGTPGSVFLTNGSTLQGNGLYFVQQDWTNDAIFIANNSTVTFYGDLQEFITSTNNTVTTFNNLVLTGVGAGNNRKKTLQLVDARVGTNGTLVINDRELETQTNTMFVLNPSTTCVTNNTTYNSEGFVSSAIGGTLSRATNSASMYIFPTGSSVATTRYRAAQLTPASAAANTYTARLGNNNATIDGFNTLALDTNMCIVNPLFYHQITRSAGTDNANIDIFYDQSTDGGWDGMAQWNTPTAALWNNMGAVTATTATPYSDVLKVNWTDFSNSPYILSRQKPTSPALTCSAVCANSPSNTFTASGGTIYTWTTPAGTTIVSGQGTNTITVDWNSTTGPITVTTASALGCASNPASCLVTISAPPVAAFDTTGSGFTFNFIDLSTGGPTSWTWDFGDGTTSGSQNTSHTFTTEGVKTVCLMASSSAGCVDTSCVDVIIKEYVVIPNTFTPDGDGINDLFYIKNSGFKDFQIDIYNRWGLKIFASDAPNFKWDGRSSAGVLMSDGTYYYILRATSFSGKDYSQPGFINLLRNN